MYCGYSKVPEENDSSRAESPSPSTPGINRGTFEAHRRGTPQQWDGVWREAFVGEGPFTALEESAFANPQEITSQEFVGRIRSMSYVGALPPDEQDRLLDGVAQLLATHPDTAGHPRLLIGQRTVVYSCRRR